MDYVLLVMFCKTVLLPMRTLSVLLYNESTFIPLMFAFFPFDLTISVQISQFSVASGLKEPITLLGA